MELTQVNDKRNKTKANKEESFFLSTLIYQKLSFRTFEGAKYLEIS